MGDTNGVLKLTRMGLDVLEKHFYTSALASGPPVALLIDRRGWASQRPL